MCATPVDSAAGGGIPLPPIDPKKAYIKTTKVNGKEQLLEVVYKKDLTFGDKIAHFWDTLKSFFAFGTPTFSFKYGKDAVDFWEAHQSTVIKDNFILKTLQENPTLGGIFKISEKARAQELKTLLANAPPPSNKEDAEGLGIERFPDGRVAIQSPKGFNINQIKVQLAHQFNCPKENLKISFEGRELRDDEVVTDPRQILFVTLSSTPLPPPSSGSEFPNEELALLGLTPEDMIRTPQAPSTSSVLTFSINIGSSESLLLTCNKEDTVEQIKESIHRMQGTPVADLVLLCNDQPMENDRTVASYFQADATPPVIRLEQRDELEKPIDLNIMSPSGKVAIKVSISETYSVKDLKMQIEQQGYDIRNIKLYCDGVLMEDHQPISHYKIDDKSTITFRNAPLMRPPEA